MAAPRPAVGRDQMGDAMSEKLAGEASGKLGDLIAMEFEAITEQFVANEEMGEKRIGLFASLTAGLGAAAALILDKKEFSAASSSLWVHELFLVTTVAWLLFGYLTFRRIVTRNNVTDGYKEKLTRLRRWYVRGSEARDLPFLPYNPEEADEPRKGLRFNAKGGYAELTALINAAIVGALGWQLVQYAFALAGSSLEFAPRYHNWLGLAVGVVGAALAWRQQGIIASRLYRQAFESRVEARRLLGAG
jgi:hypothetical protein